MGHLIDGSFQHGVRKVSVWTGADCPNDNQPIEAVELVDLQRLAVGRDLGAALLWSQGGQVACLPLTPPVLSEDE